MVRRREEGSWDLEGEVVGPSRWRDIAHSNNLAVGALRAQVKELSLDLLFLIRPLGLVRARCSKSVEDSLLEASLLS